MGKLLNNYFYGKAGKADYTVDDMPTTRMQLFRETLRVRLGGLCKLNLLYMLIWLPTMIMLLWTSMSLLSAMSYVDDTKAGETVEVEQSDGSTTTMTYISTQQLSDTTYSTVFFTLLLLIPCVGITGPMTAGAAYVTRNWSRDEHSFMGSDFKDAVKANWKQSLPVSLITGALPFIVFMCWRFYGSYASTQPIMIVPQVLILMIGILWALSVTYMHPLIVGYELRMKDVFRNALLLAVARLPMSIGIRLLHCLPIILTVAAIFLFNSMLPILICFFYYALFGFAFSRFITASYVNGVFDRYINSRIEGAEVNRGLAKEEPDDEDEAEQKAEFADQAETADQGASPRE